jgi:hypothetical protein
MRLKKTCTHPGNWNKKMKTYQYEKKLYPFFKFKFNDLDLITNNYAHLNQDMFVLSILNGKHNGTYLEIGGNYPINFNNTYLLETVFNWTGASIEILNICVNEYNRVRKNKAYCVDALKVDYKKFLKEIHLPNIIDYLSMDIDPPRHTFKAFKKLSNEDTRFRVITFEHDSYTGKEGLRVRLESRNLFKKLGYDLIINDVCYDQSSVEDWYIDPKLVDMNNVEKIRCITDNGKYHPEYFYSNL